MEFRNAQDGEEIRPAIKNMRGLREAFCVAQKVGQGLGKCALLFGSMPTRAMTGPWLMANIDLMDRVADGLCGYVAVEAPRRDLKPSAAKKGWQALPFSLVQS